MNSVPVLSPSLERSVNTRGSLLIALSVIAFASTIFSVWYQYQWSYFQAAFITESFGETYIPPNFYTYFVPMIIVFLLISAIPLLAYASRKSDKLWRLTILGTVMSASGFVATVAYHLAFAMFLFVYVIVGCMIIVIGDQIRKDRETLRLRLLES